MIVSLKIKHYSNNYKSLGILFLILFVFVKPLHAATVVIDVKGIENTNGTIEMGVYNNKESFPERSKAFKAISLKPSSSGVTHTFQNLPAGTYAIAVWHDEDKNLAINTNFFGVPKEKYGFSLNQYGSFGAPNFKKVSFQLAEDEIQQLSIALK